MDGMGMEGKGGMFEEGAERYGLLLLLLSLSLLLLLQKEEEMHGMGRGGCFW